jgi:hypothetical protein
VSTTTEQNKAVIRRFWEAWNSRALYDDRSQELFDAVVLPIALKQTMISAPQNVTRRPIPSDHRR